MKNYQKTPLIIVWISIFTSVGFGEDTLIGWDSKMVKLLNPYKNCQYEVVNETVDSHLPYGTTQLKVSLGGLTYSSDGGLVFRLGKLGLPEKITEVHIWMKGLKNNKYGPVLIFDTWCWMAKRFSPKAQIEVDTEEWQLHLFKIENFVANQDSQTENLIKILPSSQLSFCLGEAKEYPEKIVFYIGNIIIRQP